MSQVSARRPAPTAEVPGGILLSSAQEERAARLHADSIVIDCGSLVYRDTPFLDRARQGGVTMINHHPSRPVYELTAFLGEIRECRAWIEGNAARVQTVHAAADIKRAKGSGRLAMTIGPQNAEYLGTDLGLIPVLRDLGVRITQLTYQRQNHFGSGCGEARDGGLSRLGRELVAELEAAGVVVDLAHAGGVTAGEAFEVARRPPIISHGHPKRLSPHMRAFDDDVLRRLAAAGGVIGITGCSQFLYYPEAPRRRPRLDRFVEHVMYVAELIGIDHVGIGLDLDEATTAAQWDAWPFPELTGGWPYAERRCDGLTGVAELGNLSRALVWAGLTDEEARKVLGLNFLRVFEAVWGG